MKSPRSKDTTPVGSYQSNGRFILSSPREGYAGSAIAPEESPSSVRSEQQLFNFSSVAISNESDSGRSHEKAATTTGPGGGSSSAPSPALGVSTATSSNGTVLNTFKLVPLRRGNSKNDDLEYSPRGTSTPPMLSSDKRSNSDNMTNYNGGGGGGGGGSGSTFGTSRPHTAARIGPGSSAAAALSAMDDEIFSLNSGTVSEGNRKHYPRKEALYTNNNTRSNTNLFGIASQSEHKHGGSGVPKRHSTSDAAASPINPHARRDNEKRLSTNALVHSIFDQSIGTNSPEPPNRGRTASNPVNTGGRVRFN